MPHCILLSNFFASKIYIYFLYRVVYTNMLDHWIVFPEHAKDSLWFPIILQITFPLKICFEKKKKKNPVCSVKRHVPHC